MNIYQRIIAVQKVCTYVKKDSEVGYGNNAYKAVSHDAVQEVVRQAMIDNEMVVMVSQQGKGEHYDGETKSGTANIRFEAVYDVSFICADKPEDRHTVSIEAHGEDFNDKGPGKAISYAVKTAFLKTFQLATGEDDEARLEERGSRSQPATTSSTSKPAASKPKAPPAKIQELVKLVNDIFGDAGGDKLKELTTFGDPGKERFMDINKLDTYSEKWIDGAIKKVTEAGGDPF
jgi:hypothetical protein